MRVSSNEFVSRYIEWLEVIDHCINPDLYPAIRKMYCIDPRDLITPDAMFVSESHAIGFIWCSLIQKHKQMEKAKQDACIR